jgi:HTH-type transcriptional regulator / antitoxin HigA
MQLTKIETENQYQQYLDWVDKMFDEKIKPNSEEGIKVKLALGFIKEYEDLYYQIPKIFSDKILIH